MKYSQIKLVKLCSLGQEGEKELNLWLGRGYELMFEPVSVINPNGLTVLFTFGLPSKTDEYAHGLVKDTITPKQLGYLAWAFNMDSGEFSSFSITKREASTIISAHKEEFEGEQLSSGDFLTVMQNVRNEKAEAEPEKKPEAVPSTVLDLEDNQYDDDMPF